MNDSLLIQTALRNLRRKYAGNIPGLTAFADGLASESQGNPVTLTHTAMEGGSGSGQVTMQKEIWLLAAEELLADPLFNPAALPRTPRVIMPDYRLSTPV